MRKLGLFILLLFSVISYAQNTVVQLDLVVGDDDTGKKLGGATVEVYQGGKLYETKVSATNGKVPLIDLPINHTYTIYIKKEGYVTKMTEMDLHYAYPEDMPPFIGQAMDISIFKKVEGVDFAWLETTPMAMFSFDEKSAMLGFDQAYTQDQLVKIEKLKQQMEQKRLEEEKKKAEEQKRQADYQAYIKAGDAAMTTQKYDVAITQYDLALKLIPGDPTATAKLEEAKKKKAELEDSAAKLKLYNEKVAAAKAAYTAKNLEQALALYKEAQTLMPNETLPPTEIKKIEAELLAQKNKEANYTKLMAEGQTAMDGKLYDDAIAKYTAALVEKPGDPTATTKLAEAKKLKTEKDLADAKAKESQAKYDALMKEADAAFASKNYTLAKTKYTEALVVKPGEAIPTAKIKEIDEILKKQQDEADAAKAKEEEYKKLMLDGQTALTAANYDEAIAKYTSALGVKPGDPTATTKLEEAKKLKADKEQADAKAKESQAKYDALIKQADEAFLAKNYEAAKAKYTEALTVKSGEAHPTARIKEIDALLKKQQDEAAQKEADYKKFMAEGQTAQTAQLYDDAIAKYTAALEAKPGDSAAAAKLEEVKKLKADKELADKNAKATQEKYDALIKEADLAFDSKNYELAKTKYNEALAVKSGEAHPTARLKAIDDLLKKQKLEEEAAKAKEAEYTKFMAEGQAMFDQKNWEAAKQKYTAALGVKPNDKAALDKIDLINKEMEKEAAEAKKNADYTRLMAEAKVFFDQKKYTEARQKYQEAGNTKPTETEPQTKINEIDNLLGDQAKKEQLEKDYQKYMTEGNQLKDIKDYTAALDRYNKALAAKPGDAAAQQKITEINKLIEDQKKLADQEKLYNDYITKADQSFNAKDYTNARVNYQKAYEVKADPAVAAKIKEIDELIAKSQSESQTQAKYDGLMKEADALYKSGDYTKALAKYEEASLVKPTEQAPKDKISELNQKINAQQDQAEKDKKFADFIAAGDAAYTSKDYQKALANYQEAIKVKPDATISQKIGTINTLIAEQNQNLAAEEQYKARIAEADAAYNGKNWEASRDLYNQALVIKPGDAYATGRIADIEKNMQAETAQEVEANYQKIIAKADQLKSEERFDEAITYYTNAKKLKPSDPYPQQKIDEINKIKADRLNSQQEQEKITAEYNALIKEADVAFNSKNYTVALAKYKEALLKKPNDAYAQGRISEINTKLNEQNQVNSQDTEYNNYISQADALFDQQKYLESIELYRKALSVKPNDAYATNRLDEATRLEKEKTLGEEDKEYQKILAAGQKYFDLGDYVKALDYYSRAKGMKPSDPLPQKKIDEINQILDNQKGEAEFNKLKQQADTYFEKGDWKNAKIYYEKALAIKGDDSYCISQIGIINQKMKSDTSDTEQKEYQKILSKADEYFNSKNYEKAKGLYERALGIKPGDEYPKTKLGEIDRILNPDKYVTNSNALPDYGKPINGTELDANAMLLEADDQRQFMTNQKVEQQRTTAEDRNTDNSTVQEDSNFDTKDEVTSIQQDIEEQEWSAEVHRTEANLEVIEMQEQFEANETIRAVGNENDVQHTTQNVTDLNVEIERRKENSDLPREEYLADVERIKIENQEAETINSNDQGDVIIDNKAYVTQMEEEHITNDPNNDVERKNTEIYVEDMEVTLINANNQDSWEQEDVVMGVKDHTEVMVDERIANEINNDIPREEGIVTLTDYTVDYENVQSNNSSDQYDVTIDVKNHEQEMSIATEQNNLNNDIPRQETEIFVADNEIAIEENISDMSSDQNAEVNKIDGQLDDIEVNLEINQRQNDQPRQDYEEEVVAIDEQIQENKDNLSELNEDNSYKTVDQTEVITDEKVANDTEANSLAEQNSDATNDAVEDIIEDNKAISDGNTEEVEAVEDYVDELKQLSPENDNIPMKNELGEKYPEGVTEEVYAINDENGLLSKYIVRRIVVINGTGYCYEKTQTRYGGVTYTRDGQAIAEYQWTDETEAASLVRN
jgi:tetratricopeptide (TPR) repeat protein